MPRGTTPGVARIYALSRHFCTRGPAISASAPLIRERPPPPQQRPFSQPRLPQSADNSPPRNLTTPTPRYHATRSQKRRGGTIWHTVAQKTAFPGPVGRRSSPPNSLMGLGLGQTTRVRTPDSTPPPVTEPRRFLP